MTAPKPYTLTHPNGDHAIEVEPDHLDAYLSQGWVESTTPKVSKSNKD